MEDRISQLPDVIILSILSLLELSEVVKTSVLSRRWRELWKWTTRLNFDVSKTALTQMLDCDGYPKRRARSRYVTWVNQVLRLHKSPSLDEFRVKFDLDASCSHDIDGWIQFVIPRRVKILEIDLTTYSSDVSYTLSHECYSCFKSSLNLASVKCLTSLSLKDVNVNGELLEYFLSNCGHLERLCVLGSSHLVNLKVVGSSLHLKYLEISECFSLENLELCAPKLVTLNYFGAPTNFHVRNNPLLAELIIGGGRGHPVTYALVPFSSHLSQLETLKMTMVLKDDMEIPRVPTLKKLKNLTVDVTVEYDNSLLGLCNLIAAAQSLQKFTLQLEYSFPVFGEGATKPLDHPPHQSLKDVEILGFVGGVSDSELAKYLLTNSINLENVVIDPYTNRYQPSSCLEVQERAVRTRALQLKEFLPPGADLSVL